MPDSESGPSLEKEDPLIDVQKSFRMLLEDRQPPLCRFYNKGMECWRGDTPRRCHFIHDFDLREAALNRKRLAVSLQNFHREQHAAPLTTGLLTPPATPLVSRSAPPSSILSPRQSESSGFCKCRRWSCRRMHEFVGEPDKQAPTPKKQTSPASNGTTTRPQEQSSHSYEESSVIKKRRYGTRVNAEGLQAENGTVNISKNLSRRSAKKGGAPKNKTTSRSIDTNQQSNNNIDDSFIWVEVEAGSWSLSKVVVPEKINSSTHFPSLSSNKHKISPIANITPGLTGSRLDLNPPIVSTRPVPPYKRLEIPPAPRQSSTPSWDWGYELWIKRHVKSSTIANYLRAKSIKGEIPDSFFAEIPEKTSRGMKFGLFQALPGEIRQHIWNHVLGHDKFEARIKYTSDGSKESCSCAKFISQNVAPRLLHVNLESREVALKRYELAFGVTERDDHKKVKHSHPGSTYFNFERDRLFIQSQNPSELTEITKRMDSKDMERIQWLSLPLHQYSLAGENNHNAFKNAICAFKGLKALWFVIGDGERDAKYAEDKGLAVRIQKVVGGRWWAVHKTRTPSVSLKVIGQQWARRLGLDGLYWG